MMPTPPKISVPPLMVIELLVLFIFNVGVDAAETTRLLPPLAGVLKAKELLPQVSTYQVFLVHDCAE